MELETLLAAALVVTMGMGSQAVAETTTGKTEAQSQTRYYYIDNDLNESGALEPDEFTTYVYKRWDRDNDGYLSDEEWELSSVDWYRPYDVEYRTYTYWDKDGDERLDTNEFKTLISETALYDRWDVNKNGLLEQDEYAAATFAMYDSNKDGTIDLNEWKNSVL